MGKLEDIEARLERLERPCAPPIDGPVWGGPTWKQGYDSAMQGWGRCEQQRDEAMTKLDFALRKVEETEQHWRTMCDALAAEQVRGGQRVQRINELEGQQAEAMARVESLNSDNGRLAIDMRAAEERAATSLRLWQEFARKLDEKYPGRDKGEAPDDYALRLLEAKR